MITSIRFSIAVKRSSIRLVRSSKRLFWTSIARINVTMIGSAI